MNLLMTLVFCIICAVASAQQTIFTVLQGSARLGDNEFEKGEYQAAIGFYKNSLNRDPDNVSLLSKLAQCYYYTKDHAQCIATYNALANGGAALNAGDLLRYAESQSALNNYPAAIAAYKKYLDLDRDNDLIARKVWALSNIQFLREDSSHYTIRPLGNLNTLASEFGPALLGQGLVFTSNRKGTRPVDLASHDPYGPFFELYIVEWVADSVSGEKKFSRKPVRFGRSLDVSYNAGPVAFYDHGKKMVLVASSSSSVDGGMTTLGLYFAELRGSKWEIASSWPHNSAIYSVTDVTINTEGTVLYFSSGMKGGYGGKDIYRSSFDKGTWSKPINAGEVINTSGDETAPYLHRNGTLYFSSNGLPGMGGLDIFSSSIKRNGFSDPENIGYPINSHADDFGITFDSLAAHGYLSSNRVNGSLDDDIFEFTMDLQTFPFQLNGMLHYKENNSADTTALHSWPNMKLTLVDTWQGIAVQETTTEADGSFSLTIPYFSRFHLLVVDENGHEHKASLELEKYRTEAHRYEIVVVKDLFAEIKEQERK